MQGKNDGAVQGQRYFTCKPQHGIFIRPSRLTPLNVRIYSIRGVVAAPNREFGLLDCSYKCLLLSLPCYRRRKKKTFSSNLTKLIFSQMNQPHQDEPIRTLLQYLHRQASGRVLPNHLLLLRVLLISPFLRPPPMATAQRARLPYHRSPPRRSQLSSLLLRPHHPFHRLLLLLQQQYNLLFPHLQLLNRSLLLILLLSLHLSLLHNLPKHLLFHQQRAALILPTQLLLALSSQALLPLLCSAPKHS